MSNTPHRACLVAGLSLALVALAATPARAATTAAPARAPGCVVSQDSTLMALFTSGQSFPDFLAAAKARREGWLKMADSARVDDALVARAKAVGGTWHLLVVAIDACGDSMNNVPYLAKLSEMVPGLDLRMVLPVNGRPVQDSHRSIDGRTATPTFVLLDSNGNDVGCIVELPREIRDWAHGVRGKVSSDSLHAGIRTFYAANRGVAITTEAVEMLEAAKAGSPRCARGTRP
ncbi:thioredoxin family protein [Gemmatimonas sp.]|uniref:thioredoxin family protein n=1 Tax=Gemmatimonas sp. TaxID=1962908 RepID=UPI003564444C